MPFWLIGILDDYMPLAEGLFSKFHICPQGFASQANSYFSDNLSATHRHYLTIYLLPEVVYLLSTKDYNLF